MSEATTTLTICPGVGATLEAIRARLARAGVRDPRLKAEHVVASVMGFERLAWPLHGEQPVPPETAVRLEALVGRLERAEPLQYVLGETSFMGHRLATDRRALIPRPETEQLVALGLTSGMVPESGQVADVGTGSGCIAIALARARPGIRLLATDVAPGALALAGENARAHGVKDRILFRQADLLAGVPGSTLDAVLSNPPYVPSEELSTLPAEVRLFEPPTALDGGPDGTAVLRRLAGEAARALRPGGWLLAEMGERQAEAVRHGLEGAGFGDVHVAKDLAGRDRFIRGRRR